MEDAHVDLGSLAAGGTEVGRMLLSEFVLLWGHDWFVIPVDHPTGRLTTVRKLRVIDTFGVVADIAPVPPSGEFGLARHTAAPGAPAVATETGLWIPEHAPSLEGAPLERLDILLDEGSNMLWAVERRLTDELARPLEGLDARAPLSAAATTPREEGRDFVYTPFDPPPPGWVPLIAADERLEMGELLLGDLPVPHLSGRLADSLGLHPLRLHAEGLSLIRRWEVTRRRDGALVAWISRRRLATPPAMTTALVFDRLRRTAEPA
jgi:hypothetical protein